MTDNELCILANETDEAAIRAGRCRPILYGAYHVAALRAVADAAAAEATDKTNSMLQEILEYLDAACTVTELWTPEVRDKLIQSARIMIKSHLEENR